MAGTTAKNFPITNSGVDLPSESIPSYPSTHSENSILSDVPLSSSDTEPDSAATLVEFSEEAAFAYSDTTLVSADEESTFLRPDMRAAVWALIREAFQLPEDFPRPGSLTPPVPDRVDAVTNEQRYNYNRCPGRSRRMFYRRLRTAQRTAPDVDVDYFDFVSELLGHVPASLDSSSELSSSDSLDDSSPDLSEGDLEDEPQSAPLVIHPSAMEVDDIDGGCLADTEIEHDSGSDSESDCGEYRKYGSDYDSDEDSDDDFEPDEVEYVYEHHAPTVELLVAITEEERTGLALGLPGYDISRFLRPATFNERGQIVELPSPLPQPEAASAPAPVPPTFGLGLVPPLRTSFGRSSSFESIDLNEVGEQQQVQEEFEVVTVSDSSKSHETESSLSESPVLLSSASSADRGPFFAVDAPSVAAPVAGIAAAIATAMRESVRI